MNDAIELLNEIQRLMVLRGENPFKVRAFEKAAQVLTGRTDLLERAKAGTLSELPGIGKGIGDILTEFLLQGRSTVRDELSKSLPAGLQELTQISGLGPKKAILLIEELGIHSLAELEYACQENRLLKLKGFGTKVQTKIMNEIQFRKSHLGFKRLDEGLSDAEEFQKFLQARMTSVGNTNQLVVETGALRRRLELLDQLDFLIELRERENEGCDQAFFELALDDFLKVKKYTLPIQLHFTSSQKFGFEWVKTTGSQDHWQALQSLPSQTMETTETGVEENPEESSEENFYKRFGLPWIPPEARESGEEEFRLAKEGALTHLLPYHRGIRGVFHNHTTRSDGTASLEEMVQAAIQLGYEYIGISDHSQTAFYAQGLKEETLLEQEQEIQKIQKKYPDIRIFWGIESDILADGSLDYEPSVLKRFDFVIASVHSRFKMEEKEMTERILKAIRNPYTRFLGHPTGRLLLGRKGYALDMDAILKEAAHQNVAVELNSNPARLDLDWRWGAAMRRAQTLTSINPDAHDLAGLSDVQYGVAMARKAMLPTSQIINTQSTREVEKWLRRE